MILETSDDMIDAATAVAWWRRVSDKKIARWLDYWNMNIKTNYIQGQAQPKLGLSAQSKPHF